MVKKAYSVETKLACIEMKKAGKSNKVIMDTLGIKNVSQVKTWWQWYQNDELYRFHQPVGKQYTYGKGMKQLSEVEQWIADRKSAMFKAARPGIVLGR